MPIYNHKKVISLSRWHTSHLQSIKPTTYWGIKIAAKFAELEPVSSQYRVGHMYDVFVLNMGVWYHRYNINISKDYYHKYK